MEAVAVEGREFCAEVMERIRQTVEERADLSRAELSRLVCEWMNWRQPNGAWAAMSCRVALGKLARRQAVDLPRARSVRGQRRCVEASGQLDAGNAIECDLRDLGPIELVVVRGAGEYAQLWKEMIAHHHYIGYQPLVGAQVKYLIRCARGWLGALGFSAAARHVAARDRFIGWSVAARRAQREMVVANTRFLILPWVRVENLATKVLALSTKRLGRDWRETYGYRPVLLETYVDRERFHGTCYKAANWMHVGRTSGRGRQAAKQPAASGGPAPCSVKDIYLHPLSADWQRRLCREPLVSGRREALPAQRSWAAQEFGAVPCDERVQRRVVRVAEAIYAQPQAPLPQACGSRAATKAAYRMLDHSKLSLPKLLAAHAASSLERMRAHRVVLAVQDTTTLNYSTLLSTEGLGPIGYQKERGTGVVVHDTVVFTPEGVALGVLDAQVWARNEQEFGKKATRKQRPIEQKESRKWLLSFEAAAAAQRVLPQTTVVSVGDREADVYELFELAHSRADHPELLVRAEQDRVLLDGHAHLWATVMAQPVAGEQAVHVPARRARGAKGAQPARTARLAIRYAAVTLAPPRSGLSSLPMWAVLAKEVDPPEACEPLEWMLLTTLAVTDLEQAVEKLQWYAQRWQIEVYHRTLKSGCLIEDRQLGTVARLENCLAIDMVVAWRILYMTRLGRSTPDLPCSVVFEDFEWKALLQYYRPNDPLPAEPPPLQPFVRTLAGLGGFLGRKGDGEPGATTIWRGLSRLHDISHCWLQFSPAARAP
jgi:hypothetical protein